jgi:hypothetical protein
MTTIKLVVVFCIFFPVFYGCCYSQNNFEDNKAKSMLREFYTVYNKEWNTDSGFVLLRKLDSLQDIYCTKHLIKKIRQPNLDHDLFTGDMDTDMSFLETLYIKKDTTQAGTYTVSYVARSYDPIAKRNDTEQVVLHVSVVNENEKYKLDSVW